MPSLNTKRSLLEIHLLSSSETRAIGYNIYHKIYIIIRFYQGCGEFLLYVVPKPTISSFQLGRAKNGNSST